MRPEDAHELIGQRRVWVMDLKSRGPTPVVVTCTHAVGSIRIDAINSQIDIDQIWCEYRNVNGHTDAVWFVPSTFKSFAMASEQHSTGKGDRHG